jgi:hypothetical protein
MHNHWKVSQVRAHRGCDQVGGFHAQDAAHSVEIVQRQGLDTPEPAAHPHLCLSQLRSERGLAHPPARE